MARHDMVAPEALERFEVFDGLTPYQLQRVGRAIDRQKFDPGEELIVEGESTRRLYTVLDGRVEILKTDDDGDKRRLAVLDADTVLGEHGFVLGEPRTATVRALDDIEVLCLEYRAFEALDDDDPEIGRTIEHNILRMVAHRQTQINRELLTVLDETEGETGYHCDETNDIGDQLMRRWMV